GRLEEVDPQHHRPGRNEALRPGIKDAVDGAEQSVVSTEAPKAPGNPVNRIVGVPFKHRVDVAVRVRVCGDQGNAANAVDVELEAVRRHFRHERLVANKELRVWPVDRVAAVSLEAEAFVADEAHSLLVGEASVLSLLGHDIELFSAIGDATVAE